MSGYLYHRLLKNGCAVNQVYLQTRVCGEAARTRKPDIVIGTLDTDRACVIPALVCELKVFQRWGHTDQQMRRRFEGVLGEDIPTLKELESAFPNGRVEIVADFHVSSQRHGYLTGTLHGDTRIYVITSECERMGASLIWIRPINDEGQIAHIELA